jgi:dihydrolipoamide dehydrogenase
MANEDTNRRELVVIGGGPGGYAAAFLAADLGLSVTLIDKEENPGGVCSYYGCIPSKAVLHVAKVISEAAEAKEWGVTFTKPKVSVNKLRAWKDDVVGQLTGGLGQLSKQRKIEYIKGTASFIDAHTLEVLSGKKKQTIAFDKAILSTGSVVTKVPSFPDYSSQIMDSQKALELESIPKSLLVVGGGYIGLELGTVYATLGTTVTVIEMTPSLLPGVDKDLVLPLKKRLDSLFDEILLSTTVTDMKTQKNGVRVRFEPKDGKAATRMFEKVLVAVGRRPNSGGIGLENTAIELDDRGFVKVDDQRRTTEPHIYAIGDIAGEPMLAHKASHEGRVAVEAITGKNTAFEPAAIPAVVFTDPEIAWCGLTESEAKEQGKKVQTAKFPWRASGRAATLGRSDGVTKLIIDPESERILGGGITGPGAGEMISELVLAVEMAAQVSDLSLSIHPHPTLSETVMEAAEIYHGLSTHFYRPRRH